VNIELTAFATGSRERLLELVLTDPWTTSLEQAQTLLDEILSMPGHEHLRERYH
jgi:alpha-galactosidase